MKSRTHKFLYAIAAFSAIVIAGCIPPWNIEKQDLTYCPVVFGIEQSSAKIGDTIDIKGLNFDLYEPPEYVGKVFVNGQPANVLGREAESLTIVIPNLQGATDFNVSMIFPPCEFQEMIKNSLSGDISIPTEVVAISSFQPLSARHGESVTISGANFEPGNPLAHEVTFNGVSADIESVPNENTMIVTVPIRTNTGPTSNVSGKISIKVDGVTATSDQEFEYEFTTDVSTIAGTPLTPGTTDGLNGLFKSPHGIDLSEDGNFLYVADRGAHTIRKLDIQNGGSIETIAGKANESGYVNNPVGIFARFNFPEDVAVEENVLFVTDRFNSAIRNIDLNNNNYVNTFIGGAPPTPNSNFMDGSRATALMKSPVGICIKNGVIFFSDRTDHRVRKYDPISDMVKTVSGNGLPDDNTGTFGSSQLNTPAGVAVYKGADKIFVADRANHKIKIVHADSSDITTRFPVSGNLSATLNEPSDMAYDGHKILYVVDHINNRILGFNSGGEVIVTIGSGIPGSEGGPGETAKFRTPTGIAIDIQKYVLYISDTGNSTIRKVTFE